MLEAPKPVQFLEFAARRLELTQASTLQVLKLARLLGDQGPEFWEALREMGLRRFTQRQQLGYAGKAETELQRAAWLGQALEAKEMHTVLRSQVARVLALQAEFDNNTPSEPLEW